MAHTFVSLKIWCSPQCALHFILTATEQYRTHKIHIQLIIQVCRNCTICRSKSNNCPSFKKILLCAGTQISTEFKPRLLSDYILLKMHRDCQLARISQDFKFTVSLEIALLKHSPGYQLSTVKRTDLVPTRVRDSSSFK